MKYLLKSHSVFEALCLPFGSVDKQGVDDGAWTGRGGGGNTGRHSPLFVGPPSHTDSVRPVSSSSFMGLLVFGLCLRLWAQLSDSSNTVLDVGTKQVVAGIPGTLFPV